jgi:hypothetical protein
VTGTDITLPADFASFVEPKIYLGDFNNPFSVIPFDERRLYVNQNNFAYLDVRQGKIVLTKEQDHTYNFDYIYQPPAITISVTPVFPKKFWGMFPFFMASDNSFIQLDEKARSYAMENRARGEMILGDMKMENDRLTMMETYGN